MDHSQHMQHMQNAEPMHHTMAGFPDWLLWSSIVCLVIITVISLMRSGVFRDASRRSFRFNLLSIPFLSRWIKSRGFQFSVQLPLVLALFLILTAGFFGTPVAGKNIATILTWTLWWTLLIVDIVLLGRMWCLVCPWDALASWIRRLTFWKRKKDEPLALNYRWPSWLKNVYPAVLLFLGLTWLELGFGVTFSPWATAVLGTLMIFLAIVPALIFERRAFCQYGCLIGRICGLYSMMAPIELRPIDYDVCTQCHGKECIKGNDHGYECPTTQYPPKMQTNTYCTLCSECIKSCDKDNLAINLRPWATDLMSISKPRRDEATLAIVMLAMTMFHGLSMTPVWNQMIASIRNFLQVPHIIAFSIGMLGVLIVPTLIYFLFVRLAAVRQQAPITNFVTFFAYPLIAIALMYHLAHNVGHLLMEGMSIVPAFSDPFGWGWNLFGTAAVVPRPLTSMKTIWFLQITFVLLGHFWANRAALRIEKRINGPEGLKLRSTVFISLMLLAASLTNVWLLSQPMEMRTGL